MRLVRLIAALASILAGLLLLAPPAHAAPADVQRVETPFFFYTNDCNGETLRGSAIIQQITITQSGTTRQQNIILGVSATSSQGNTYRTAEKTHTVFYFDPFNAVIKTRFTLVSQGSAPNLMVVGTFNTITGEFTVVADCTGTGS
jgi:hypothetical protein